jgi:enolase-phosphatase E1
VNGTPAEAGIGAILLDIEGTTTPVAFVTDVLFPYARAHLRPHLHQHAGEPDCEALIKRLREEHAAAVRAGEPVTAWTDEPSTARLSSVIDYAEWLMDRDRKSTGLKELQGKIWEDGYRSGQLVGEVFPDVRPALQRWRDRHLRAAIFSSGSVLAQQLLFRHSSAGDLTGLLERYFDTHVGAKVESDSYRRIANELGLPAPAVMFLSDVTRELDAAQTAGMQVRLVVRPGNAAVPADHGYQTVRSLDEIAERP